MRILMALAAAGLAVIGVSATLRGGPRLEVHEWGTFTTVSGADGAPLVWRPLSGPTDLPSFVYGSRRNSRAPRLAGKGEFMAQVRLETPVIYFYADRELEVDVKVRFPRGEVTEWYPAAIPDARGIDWTRVRVRPGEAPTFPREPEWSHYYPARETDAAPVRVQAGDLPQDEKFLFYRGVGWCPLPLKISLTEDRVIVENTGPDPIAQAILFENQQGKAGFRVLGPVRGRVNAARPELTGGISELALQLHRTLVAAGLYEKEAAAMIRTWQESWFEEGLRLIYLLPRSSADGALPLRIDPPPAELVRVFVGRAELITPAAERKALAAVVRAGNDLGALRREFAPLGRFLAPVLSRALRLTEDPALQARIAKLLEDPSLETAPPSRGAVK